METLAYALVTPGIVAREREREREREKASEGKRARMRARRVGGRISLPRRRALQISMA